MTPIDWFSGRPNNLSWYEENVEYGGCREISSQEARGVGEQPRSRVKDCQAEEGDRPHTVEDLEKETKLELIAEDGDRG